MEVCKRRSTLRDKNGSIILPIIVIKRTSVGFDDAMPLSFDNDVQGKYISVVRSSSGWSKNNRYDRFNCFNRSTNCTRVC